MLQKEQPTNEEAWQELRALQKKSLEILLYFKEFCQTHGLLFYFCGGCCIGTLRHKGFIPWDDDIDVFMPRPDYERLQELWPRFAATKRYAYCRNGKDVYLRSLLTAISDENTTFIKERQKDLAISHGVRLEILPLDAYPDSKLQRRMQIFWALLYQTFGNNEPPTSKGKLLELVGRFLLALTPTPQMRFCVWHFAEQQMSKWPITKETKYVTELCARYQYMVNRYPAEAFASATYKEFEGYQMPLPVGYDAYLTMAFGDYMRMPPPEKQIPKHEAVWVDLQHSYKEYKGKYYCVEEKT